MMIQTSELPASSSGLASRPGPSATHWSMIQAAGDPASPRHREALEELAQRTWHALYAYARRQGASPDDARDSTQGFLERFLERNTVARADPARGRFRTFLLTCFKNYLVNEHDRGQAVRRGGGCNLISRDAASAESRYLLEPVEAVSPDQVYDRQWALATLDRALAAVREEYAAAGKQALHDGLRSLLWGEPGEATYRELGVMLGMTEAAVKMAVVRLRRRCRIALLDEIARTVCGREEVEDEFRHIMAALRG